MGPTWVSALRSSNVSCHGPALTGQWPRPSCGKTTLARLIAKRTNAIFRELSATAVGINDVRPIFDEAKGNLQLTGRWVKMSNNSHI